MVDIAEKLAELKENYIRSLPSKFDDIQNLWIKVYRFGERESLKEMYRLAHSLAGSGATFDQVELSKKAKVLELYLKDNEENISENKTINHISGLLTELKGVVNVEESSNTDDEATTSLAASSNIRCIHGAELDEVASIRILLADDDDDSRAKIAAILEASGHEVYEVRNGEQAVEYFEQYDPDLILLDVIMPIMNGYTAAEIIKRRSKGRFIPVIFLTAITDSESLADCISAGGDDFLNKPVHPVILAAKIKAMQRIKEAYKKLDEYQKKTEEELETSELLFKSLIDSNHERVKNLDCWAIFPGHFSGDVQLSAQLENGDTYVLLCDFTGHGLPAALGTMFVADLFQTMTRKSMPAEIIIDEINKKMHHILPVGRYCASVMVAFNQAGKQVKVWNYGLPTVYLVNKDRKIIKELASSGLPLGVVATTDTQNAHIISQEEGCSLVVYSDGVTEAENNQKEMYSEARFYTFIENTPSDSSLFLEIKKELKAFVADAELFDDLSLMVLTF